MTEPAVVEWVEVAPGALALEHDGPCVFIDGECACGTLDLGVPRD